MNARQLLFVKAVAETRSFSKAAEICHATQPTLSNAISQLEEELGGKLFSRTTRKVSLTSFGEYLFPFVLSVLNERKELKQAAEAYHNPDHKLIRIGLSPLIDMRLLTQVVKPFQHAHPRVNIFFKECLLDDMAERMNSEQIDFAVLPTNAHQGNHEHCFFYQEPLLYLPQEVGLTEPGAVQYRIGELPEAPVILTGGGCGLNGTLEAIFEDEGVKLKSYPGHALSYPVIEEWASLGIGAGILPRAKVSEDNKRAVPLCLNDGQPATFSYEWSWSPDLQKRQDITEFIEYLATTMPALVRGEGSFAVA